MEALRALAAPTPRAHRRLPTRKVCPRPHTFHFTHPHLNIPHPFQTLQQGGNHRIPPEQELSTLLLDLGGQGETHQNPQRRETPSAHEESHLRRESGERRRLQRRERLALHLPRRRH